MNRYPHLEGANEFPHLSTARPFEQCQNTFDYSRWDAGTQVLLCSVPFDCIDDFPKWESTETRRAWFSKLDGYRLAVQDSMRMVHDGIKLPIPFDATNLYNYVWVTLPRVTSDSAPLDNEPASGVREWGFFIRDMEFRSPSVTALTLMPDWWGTFIVNADVAGVMLQRGHHALMNAVTPSVFLSDPNDNMGWLGGTEPLTSPRNRIMTKIDVILNGSAQYAVFVTAASMSGTWGADANPRVGTTAAMFRLSAGSPQSWAFAIAANDVAAFLSGVPSTFPQTVRGVYLVSGDLLSLGDSFAFGGVTCHWVIDGRTRKVGVRLSATDFGYPARYANLTKLYTGQFAHLTVTTDRGQSIDVAIEDLGSSPRLAFTSQVQEAGFVVVGILSDVGSSDARNVSFYNLASLRNHSAAGAWLDTLLTWEVPCYAVFQGSGEHYDATHKHAYDTALANAQRSYSAATNSNAAGYSNTVAAADTALTNATASADTNLTNAQAASKTATDNTARNATLTTTNAGNSADNITANNAVTVAASTANNTANVNAANSGASASTNKLILDTAADLNASYAALTAEQAVVSVTMSNNDARSQTATTNNNISTATSLASGVVGMVGSAVSGDIGGVIGGVAGIASTVGSAVTSQNSIATDWQTCNASALVTASNNQALYQAGVNNAQTKSANAKTYTTTATQVSNTAKTAITTNNNDAATSVANNNASLTNTNAANTANTMNQNAQASQTTTNANAQRTRDTGVANAQRTHDTQVANAGRSRDAANNSAAQGLANAQASTNATRDDAYAAAPLSFGSYSGGATASTVPMIASVQVRRPTDGEISAIGDQMLRYGYVCSRYVESPDLAEMPHFTYWQCSDVWVRPSGECPEVAANVIRDALRRGATIWKDPSEVGTVSIYDNLEA